MLAGGWRGKKFAGGVAVNQFHGAKGHQHHRGRAI